MAHLRSKFVVALILFTLQVTTSAKNNARPVYEVINEQARMDDIRVSDSPAILPYGNPLAGNSAHNARLHASNQQAMFNAEKIRQHKAQLQRLNQGPPIIDSYMRAYHESQESHQLALEQQQAVIKESITTTQAPSTRKQIRNRTQNRQRTNNRERNDVKRQRQEFKSRTVQPDKVTRSNIENNERSRNHRSYGSVEYEQYLQSKLPLAYLTATASDQGVTIKPNGNLGVKSEEIESSNLHATVIPPVSIGKYLPKSYLSVKEINTLESILKKNPNEQLTEFKTLIDSKKSSDDNEDVYYKLKEPSSADFPEYYNSGFTQTPSASVYALKDHTPITEEIEDIENPVQYQHTFVTPQLSSEAPVEDTTTVNNNYYEVEVARQKFSAALKPSKINEELYLEKEKSYHNVADDFSGTYLKYANGVQHLTEDGTEISAYGDDNLHYAANYEFGYRVRDPDSGNYYGQYEAKAGERTSGNYHVLLPDGRMQKVHYFAGPSGYHADISYDHLEN